MFRIRDLPTAVLNLKLYVHPEEHADDCWRLGLDRELLISQRFAEENLAHDAFLAADYEATTEILSQRKSWIIQKYKNIKSLPEAI